MYSLCLWIWTTISGRLYLTNCCSSLSKRLRYLKVIKIDTAVLIAVHVNQGSPDIHDFIIALTAAWFKCFKEGHRLCCIFLREARRRHATASSLAGADFTGEYLSEHFEKAAIFTFKRSKVGIWSKLPLNCKLRFTMNTRALLQALITGQP